MTTSILIIDDEPAICNMLSYALKKAHLKSIIANHCKQADKILREQKPALIILDWMLPDRTGIAYLKYLRHHPKFKEIPIIMLTAKSEETDTLSGLNNGADDYMTKPVSTRELIARIKAILRRTSNNPKDEIKTARFKDLELDYTRHKANFKEQEIKLSKLEFKLLFFFITHPELVHSRNKLIREIWGEHIYVEERTIDVHIRRLRNILKPYHCHQYIQTVRGIGYRFSEQ